MNDPDNSAADEVARAPAHDQETVLDAVTDRARRRRQAIKETAGSLPDIWKPGDLERLRDEWDRSRPHPLE